MRFLADENFPRAAITGLRSAGHDVLSAKESMRAMPDGMILTCASNEQRIVLTCDKDFGELAVRFNKPCHGILLFRLGGNVSETDANRMLAVVSSRDDWEGHLSVVTDSRIRMRRLAKFGHG